MWAGGGQELELADEYDRYASMATRWPRTRAILKSLADGYRREAARWDAEADLEQDLD
jgi:hypothetical protein